MKTIIVIPARYQSSRFIGKPLVPIANKPMIQHVAEIGSSVVGKENVYVATDDSRIKEVVENLGYRFVMTPDSCLTGTDRIALVAKEIEADIYVSVMGDEPLIDPNDIQRIITHKKTFPNDIINCYTKINEQEDPEDNNIPKVVFTEDQRLIYISRQPLPGFKSMENKPKLYYKQVNLYAYNKQELLDYNKFGRKSIIEEHEDIEILRFFELGKTIRMIETKAGRKSVDVPEDVQKVEQLLNTNE